MSTTEWLVLGGGVAIIVWLNWYFLFADRKKRAEPRADGTTRK